ncbi:sigma-70 family RNA polymerase sigma factor [Opitutus sp. GAS368]|uniref:RNA polymerase sigma factor n=1 Tax=Opitutus sp. GAS368 TaxID=1882749 RepID=UPI00087B842C|nr:sigma-70 family RNA polymerase sigma factor [Opitutus sp. GAS368]SDR89170.1 RNA polymerase sigma-70 factor, ECF subfamily [Opitutus sp. GAS368]
MPPQDSSQARWFATEVQPHQAMLRAWLQSRFPPECDIDNLVQEALVRVCQAWARGEVQSPKAFLFATARNLALDQVRRQKIVPMISLVETDTQAVLEEGTSIPDLVAHNQELEFLTEVIQSLPDRCRQVFTLRKVYGMSQQDIATQLGISEHTVSAQLTIALHKCTAHFARHRRERGGRP